jgi:L-lactate dehydrogenase complex protein LldG
MKTGTGEFSENTRKTAGTREEVFLERIARRLGRGRPASPPLRTSEEQGAPEWWRGFQLEEEERIQTFITEWEKLGGKAVRCPTLDDAGTRIAELFEKWKVKQLIRWRHPLLEGLHLSKRLPELAETTWDEMNDGGQKESGAKADAGLVVADFAIAHTGTVVLVSGKMRGRSVSLLPPAMVVLVRAEDVVTRMGEALTGLKKRYEAKWPSGIHFVTGPSRSADIENDLTIGVHGPGKVIAAVVHRCGVENG